MTTDAQPQPQDWAQRFAQAVDHLSAVVGGTPEGRWDAPSPCTEWSARGVVNHAVMGATMLTRLLAGDRWEEAFGAGQGDLLGGDPKGAYAAAAQAARAAVVAPGALTATINFASGDMPAERFITMMFADLLVHSWDLAKATGQDAALPAELADACYALMLPRRGQMPASDFAPEVAVAEDADTQTRLLAMLGRDPAWAPSGR